MILRAVWKKKGEIGQLTAILRSTGLRNCSMPARLSPCLCGKEWSVYFIYGNLREKKASKMKYLCLKKVICQQVECRAYLRGYGSPRGYISPNSEFNFAASVKSWHGSWGNAEERGKKLNLPNSGSDNFFPAWLVCGDFAVKCRQSGPPLFFFQCPCIYEYERRVWEFNFKPVSLNSCEHLLEPCLPNLLENILRCDSRFFYLYRV